MEWLGLAASYSRMYQESQRAAACLADRCALAGEDAVIPADCNIRLMPCQQVTEHEHIKANDTNQAKWPPMSSYTTRVLGP